MVTSQTTFQRGKIMKINEVEQSIGITKKNIRFYEQEGLLNPSRGANGYREYSEEDVTTLQQIKLLRRLDIPIEEIKKLQTGTLTLEDCLRRHLIVLERRSKNINAMEGFCNRLLNESFELRTLPISQLLTEMDQMEEGGTKFVNVQSKDKTRRKKDSLIAALVAIVFMVMFLLLMLWAIYTEPEIPVILVILIVSFPLLGIVGTILALKERFSEIEGGELDEASKY